VNLDDHPFRVLRHGTRTRKSEILARAQSLLLTDDAERVRTAAATVTHPSKRIDAEVSWFVGIPPAQLGQVLWAIEQSDDLPAKCEHLFIGLNPLTQFNLVYFWTIRRPALSYDTWGVVLQHLSDIPGKITTSEVTDLLNADRAAAGIPQIADQKQVADALQRHIHTVVDSVVSHLVKADTPELIITHFADQATTSGNSPANDFAYRLIDQYGTAIQPILNKCSEQIDKVCIRALADFGPLRTAPPELHWDCDRDMTNLHPSSAKCARCDSARSARAEITDGIIHLETLISQWSRLTRAVQLAMKSRGLPDSQTIEVANFVRCVVVELSRDYEQLYSEARQLTFVLHEAFQDNPTIAAWTRTDLDALDRLVKAKAEEDALSPDFKQLRALCAEVWQQCDSQLVRENGHCGANKAVCDKAGELFRREIEPALKKVIFNLPPGEVIKVREQVARCLSWVAVAYTWADDFVKSEELQREALTWAQDTAVAADVKEALERVHKPAKTQRLLAELTPVSSAPSLWTLNGFGFALYGNSDQDTETGSYVTTHYFVALFIPLFPLARYRVVNSGKGYRFLGKLPLRKWDRWHLGIAAAILTLIMITGAMNTPSNGTQNPAATVPSTQATVLKSQIDSDRSAIDLLKRKLQPVLDDLQKLKARMDSLDSELKSVDQKHQSGIPIDIGAYNKKVTIYNDLLKKYNDIVSLNADDLKRYDDLLSKDSAMVEQYNSLIKRK